MQGIRHSAQMGSYCKIFLELEKICLVVITNELHITVTCSCCGNRLTGGKITYKQEEYPFLE